MKTISQIASELGVGRHRVVWVVAERGIRPVGKIGNTMTFDDAATEMVRLELTAIDARRRGVSA